MWRSIRILYAFLVVNVFIHWKGLSDSDLILLDTARFCYYARWIVFDKICISQQACQV
jgi:hypothetical protein